MEHAQRLAKVGSWRLDHSTGELSWSREIFRILGIAPISGSLSYEFFLDCVHPDDREKTMRSAMAKIEAGFVRRFLEIQTYG